MNRILHEISQTTSQDTVTMFGALRGAGAAIPVVPSTTFSRTSSIGYMSAANNMVASATRTGVGLYTFTLQDNPPVVFDIGVSIWGLDGKWAQMSDYNPSKATGTIKVYAAGGGAADLAATDFLRLTIVGQTTVLP